MFNSYDNITTGLEGIQMIQIAFPSEITYTKIDSMFLPLLQTSNQSAVMTDFFNLGALPEMNPILNNLNESSKIIGGRLQTPYGGNIFLITDSDFLTINLVTEGIIDKMCGHIPLQEENREFCYLLL